MKKLLLALLFCSISFAQSGYPVTIKDTSGNAINSTSNALNVLFTNSTIAVTGTFFQTTQPVSIATMPSTPVTGTFWQATQPVSGTFWQATQPVSGTLGATQSGTWTVQPGNTANTTAWKVDGSAVTQPVSAATLPLPSGAATAAKQPALGTAGSAATDVISIQGIASMTKLLVTPDSVALPANQSVNLAQVAGATTATSNTGVQKVGIVGNAGAAVDAATGAAPPANAVLLGGLASGATGGFVTAIPVCDSFFNINIGSGTTTLAVTGVSGRHVRICAIDMVVSAADNVGIISGTGGTCGTGTGAIVGTTAATGWNFAANGGISKGSGIGTIMRTVATGDSVCIVTSATAQLSGVIAYAIY